MEARKNAGMTKSLYQGVARYAVILIVVQAIILALLPWYSSHLQTVALDQAERGLLAESLGSARMAVWLDPVSVKALFDLARVQQEAGWPDEARQTLIRATELQPLNYQTWEQLALYERDSWNQPEAAREHFARAISLNPMADFLREEAREPAGAGTASGP